MDIPEEYRGSLRMSVFEAPHPTRAGKMTYLLVNEDVRKGNRFDAPGKRVCTYLNVDFNFVDKLENAVIEVNTGKLHIDDLDKYIEDAMHSSLRN